MTPFERISIDTAQEMIDAGAVVVDVRDEQSFRAAHIPGALYLDNSTVQEFIESADLDAPLVVYCYHGNSSQGAAAFFHEKGFARTYSVDGGFEAWRGRFPVQTD